MLEIPVVLRKLAVILNHIICSTYLLVADENKGRIYMVAGVCTHYVLRNFLGPDIERIESDHINTRKIQLLIKRLNSSPLKRQSFTSHS